MGGGKGGDRPRHVAGADRHGDRGLRARQRLLGDQRRDPADRAGLRHRRHHRAVGRQRLRAHLRRPHRHRRPTRRHVRAQAGLLHRLGDLRDDVAVGRRRPDRGLADHEPRADGDRWRADVARDPGHDLRGAARCARRARRRSHPRGRRDRQRGRAADRGRAHRLPQLALDLLPQPAGHGLRGLGHRASDPPAQTGYGRREDRLLGHRHRLGRPGGAAGRLRRGDQARLGRRADHRPAGPVRGPDHGLRPHRAQGRPQRAGPGGRDAKPRLHLLVRCDRADVGGLLRLDALPAAVHAGDARLHPDPGGPGDAADDGPVRGSLVRRRPAV